MAVTLLTSLMTAVLGGAVSLNLTEEEQRRLERLNQVYLRDLRPPKEWSEGPDAPISDSAMSLVVFVVVMPTFGMMYFLFCWYTDKMPVEPERYGGMCPLAEASDKK